MLKYSIKRILLAFLTAFIILTLTFILVKALPPRDVFAPDKNGVFAFYSDQVDLGYFVEFSEANPKFGEPLKVFLPGDVDPNPHYYYVKPIMDQYFTWLGNIVTKWDWGRSTAIKPNASAISIIASRLPTSMSINIVTIFVSVPLGILLGIIAGLKKIQLLTIQFLH